MQSDMGFEPGDTARLRWTGRGKNPWHGAVVRIDSLYSIQDSLLGAAYGQACYDFTVIDTNKYPPHDDEKEHSPGHPYRGTACEDELEAI